MRCMQHLAELTPRLVQQFTQIDDTREMALVATGSGGAIMEVFFYWTTLVSYPTIVPKEREPAPGQRHDDDARPAPLTSDVRRLIL
ncbi:MAG TPA: hypothetical protein VIM74_03565 [Casimicrobiaceae bacterium]